MPKKTKKEKLLANARRSHLAPVATSAPAAPLPIAPADHSFSFSLSAKKTPVQTSTTTAHTDYRVMKRDLVKTVLITGAILVGEFLLTYWLPR
jgi:hypothetical protein